MTMLNRRNFATLSIAATGAALSHPLMSAHAAAADDGGLRSEFLLDFDLDTQQPVVAGFPGGDESIVGITGGTFQGPKLKGKFRNVGGDWIVVRPDGSRLLDVRAVLVTDEDDKISMTWRGIAYTESGGALFARILPMFQTSAAKYLWLNKVVSVGVFRPGTGKVSFRVYQIL